MSKLKINSIRIIMRYYFAPKEERCECNWSGCSNEGVNLNSDIEEDDMLCNKHLKEYYKYYMNN